MKIHFLLGLLLTLISIFTIINPDYEIENKSIHKPDSKALIIKANSINVYRTNDFITRSDLYFLFGARTSDNLIRSGSRPPIRYVPIRRGDHKALNEIFYSEPINSNSIVRLNIAVMEEECSRSDREKISLSLIPEEFYYSQSGDAYQRGFGYQSLPINWLSHITRLLLEAAKYACERNEDKLLGIFSLEVRNDSNRLTWSFQCGQNCTPVNNKNPLLLNFDSHYGKLDVEFYIDILENSLPLHPQTAENQDHANSNTNKPANNRKKRVGWEEIL